MVGVLEYKEPKLMYGANTANEEALFKMNMRNEEQRSINNMYGAGFNNLLKKNKNKNKILKTLKKNKNKLLKTIQRINVNIIKNKLKNKTNKKLIKNKKTKYVYVKTNKKNNKKFKLIKFKGGNAEVPVPTFGSGNTKENASSVQLNSLLLKSQQDSSYDKDIIN